MSVEPISRTEFHSFRVEMREHMQQQTQLMNQIVELQTKHHHLESQFTKLEKSLDGVETRLRPIEASQSGTYEKTKYNRDITWLILAMVVGVAAYAIKGGL